MCAHRLTTADIDAGMDDLQQPCGLQPAHVLVARAVLHSLAPAWTLDEHHDASDGSLMLILTPPGPEDATPTFVLSHTPNGIQVTAALGDTCDTLHTEPTLRRATWAALNFHHQSTGLIAQSLQAATKG